MENTQPLKTDNIMDFRNYLRRLLRSWYTFVACFIVCIGVALIYLRYATPQYHINAKLLIEDQKKGNGGASSVAAMDFGTLIGGGSSVDNEVEVLKTRYLMDRLVRSKQLNFIWYRLGDLRDVEMDEDPFEIEIQQLEDTIMKTEFRVEVKNRENFSLSYEDRSTKEQRQLDLKFDKVISLPKFGVFVFKNKLEESKTQKYKLMISSIDSRVSSLKSLLTIDVTNKLASTIDIQLDYPLTGKGERILTGFINEYIEQNRRDKSRIADSTVAFIDERILLVNSELNGIEGNIQAFMQDKGLANIAEQSKLLFQSSTEYIKQLAEIEGKIEVINGVEDLLKKEGNNRLVAGSVLTDDPSFSTLMNSYNNLNLERERLLLSYTSDNPYVINTDQRIASITENILEYLKNSRNNLSVSKKEIEKNSGRLQGNIRQVPAQQRTFLDLSRQQQLKQELYLFLLQKREETAVANTSNIAGIRIIDPPKAVSAPFKPNRRIILFAALLFAFAMPIGKIYIEDLLNNKVLNRKDIEKRTMIPVIAELMHNNTGTDLIEFKSSRIALAEQFRALRSNLKFMMPKGEDKVILVTSGMPGEGKSFTSLNLANVYAVSGKKVLLLEFDLRKPKLSKIYTGLSKVGISNYIVDQSLTLDDFINPVGDTGNLYFGACGPIPPNPAELILSERVEQMMKAARECFDYIIIDAPPIMAVIDAQLLSAYCDVSLYVVRSGYTPHDLLSLPENAREQSKMKNIAIVLNDINENAHGYYGHSYGYYHLDDQKRPWWKFGKKV
ncbi:MAG TPA: polysaccharide biosynthesis tyrosine autokinase [Pseudosphingobacterium sp.]|nr:polysaccharide biosynthesis tyrosine autokinase [Pseudosphingobacterium sp.]